MSPSTSTLQIFSFVEGATDARPINCVYTLDPKARTDNVILVPIDGIESISLWGAHEIASSQPHETLERALGYLTGLGMLRIPAEIYKCSDGIFTLHYELPTANGQAL